MARPPSPQVISRSWFLFAVAMMLALAGLVLMILTARTPYPSVSDEPHGLLPMFIAIVETWIGALITSRRPRDRVGSIFLAAGALAILMELARAYATYTLLMDPGRLPAGIWAAWLSYWGTRAGAAVLLIAFLYFPTGTLPSPRWRYALGLAVLGFFGFAARAFVPGTLGEFDVANPFGIESLPAAVETGFYGGMPLSALAAAGAIALIRRFRKAAGPERQQIKWLVLPLVSFAIAVTYTITTLALGIADRAAVRETTAALYGIFGLSVPVAMGIAILRHGLYDIDLLINRAIVYGALTALVAGAYAAGSKLLERFFVALTGESTDASTLVTIFVIAVAFTPVRTRIQAIVDKRFKEPATLDRRLATLTTQVQLVTGVLDRERLAVRFLTETVEGTGAPGGSLHLHGTAPISLGVAAGGGLEIALHARAREIGLLRLTPRANGTEFSPGDREVMQRAADIVAEALAGD